MDTIHLPLVAKRTNSFGLDIGSETIKAVQLRRHGRGLEIQGYTIGPLPKNVVTEGIITEPKALATHIRALLTHPTQGTITADAVSASLPASKIFTRLVTLPSLKKKDLAEAVRFEVEQSIPVPPGQLYVDWAVIGSYKEGKEKRSDVLIAAAGRPLVESYLHLFAELSLVPIALETELEPISRAIIATRGGSRAEVIVDIGAEMTDFSIISGGAIRVAGSTPVGGFHFTDAISKELGLDTAKATEYKLSQGIGKPGEDSQVHRVVAPLLETIVTEVRRMTRFYEDHAGGRPLSGLVLSGGSSTVAGIREYFAEELQMNVEIGNPWAGIRPGSTRPVTPNQVPIFTTAIGLALGGFDADH